MMKKKKVRTQDSKKRFLKAFNKVFKKNEPSTKDYQDLAKYTLEVFELGESDFRITIATCYFELDDSKVESISFSNPIYYDAFIEYNIVEELNREILFIFSSAITDYYRNTLIRIVLKEDIVAGCAESLFHIILSVLFDIFEFELKRKVLSPNTIAERVTPRLKFLDVLLDRRNYIIKPNKKYDEEIFNFTSDLLFNGKKKYVACMETLEHFRLDSEKFDSYRKRYDAFLNRK